MAILSSDLIRQGASGASTGYTIDQSIRFNEAENAYMHRTPSGAGNRRTWTWSGWLKHTMTSTNGYHNIWTVRSDSNNFFEIAKRVTASGDNFMDITNMTSSTRDIRLITNRHFRDPAAWYHFVFVADTTNVDPSARIRMYVNGIRETSFSTETLPSQNLETFINTTNKHEIGAYNGGSGYMMDGYMAEINFVDGYAYGPEYFGEFKEDTDIWIPKEYTGSYGTNGYHIDGRDSSDLGDDESGNGNDFTTSGMAAHDQMKDSPTNNFCVLNSISILQYGGNFNRGVAQTDLAAYNAGGAETYAIGTMAFSSGKWYWEFYTTSYPAGNGIIYGITEQDYWEANGTTSHSYIGKRAALSERHTSSAYSYWAYSELGSIGNGLDASGLTPFQQGVVVGVAVDMTNNIIAFTTNGSSYGTKDFDTYSYAFGSKAQFPVWRLLAATTLNVNFGQDSTFNGNISAGGNSDGNGIGDFKYAVPSGHLALCTSNLGAD